MIWTMKPVELALVGCGNIARAHAKEIQRNKRCRLRIVCDVESELARQFQLGFSAKLATDRFEQVLGDPHVEAVVLATPNHLHLPQTLKALEAGKHVLVEKPMATNTEDALRMIDCARHSDRRLLVGQVMRFWPNVVKAREAIRSGTIGRLRHISRRRLVYQVDAGRPWAYDPAKTGGWLIHGNAVHELDSMLYMAGFGVTSVHALTACNNPKWQDVDELSAVLEFEDGAVGSLVQSLNSHVSSSETILIGESGSIFLKDWHRGYSLNGQEEMLGDNSGFGDQLMDFVMAIREDRPSRIDASEILDTMYVLDGLRKSSQQRESICIPAVTRSQAAPSELRAPRTTRDLSSPHETAVQSARGETATAQRSATRKNNGLVDILFTVDQRYCGDHDIGVVFESQMIEKLRSLGNLHEQSRPNQKTFPQLLANTGAQVLVSFWGSPKLTIDIYRANPQIEYLCHVGGSVGSVVDKEVIEAGLLVTNWGKEIAKCVAEGALMMILSALRRVPRLQVSMHECGGWPSSEDFGIESLIGQKVGLYGLGNVGQELVELLTPFGCSISVYSPHCPDEILQKLHVNRADSLEELFSKNRVISIHTALTKETIHRVNASLLARMPEGAVLVNTARGLVIDTPALVAELKQGRIGAALDVFEEEPLDPKHPLRGLENCLLIPHMAGPTPDRRRDLGELAVRQVERFLNGEQVDNVVTPSAFDYLVA